MAVMRRPGKLGHPVSQGLPRVSGSPARQNCCAKASLAPDLRSHSGILLTVRGRVALCSCRGAKDFAMIETVTACLGLFSAGIFLAHAFEGFRSRT